MLQDQIFPVDFSGGINTKTDPKKVVSGEFLLVQDGVYTEVDNIQKRNGYSALPLTIANGGGNLVLPRMVATYNGELTAQDSGQLYSFSTQLQAWEKQGNYTSIDFATQGVYQQQTVTGGSDVAIVDGITFYVFEAGGLFSAQAPFVTAVDTNTGVVVLPVTALNAPLSPNQNQTPRVVVLSPTSVAAFYLTSGNRLAMKILTVNANSVTIGSQIIVQANASSGSGQASYDVASTATGCVVAVSISTGAVGIITIDTTGTSTHTQSVATSGIVPVSVMVASNGNIWVYYADTSGSVTSLLYAIYDPSLTPVLAPTVIFNAPANVPITQITAQSLTNTAQTVFYELLLPDTGGSSSQTIAGIESSSVNSTGTAVNHGIFLLGIGICSRVFTFAGSAYFLAYYNGPSYDAATSPTTSEPNFQPTYFIVDIANVCIAGRFASGLANALTRDYVAQVAQISGSQFVFLGQQQFTSTISNGGQTITKQYGAEAYFFSFNTPRVYMNKQAGQLNILNGALISAYDGQTCAEWGFHLFPEIFSFTRGTGVIPAGTYAYAAIYTWLDANGNLHQSPVSKQLINTFTGATSDFIIEVTIPLVTGKNIVDIQLYRTKESQGLFFLVETISNQNLATGQWSVEFVDNTLDADLGNSQELYTNGGISENSTPPPSIVMEERFNRLWFTDAGQPNTIWYTKTFEPGFGLAPSAFNVTQVEPSKGNIAGLVSMDDKMIVFKDFGALWFAGDGANDAGTNSSLTQPQIIPTANGLTWLGSLVLIPSGIIYQSAKGIFMLDRGMGVHYADQSFNGSAVEAYSKNAIHDARIIPNTTQVRFLFDTGVALHYDYMYGKWSVFTNHTGYSSDIWENTYVYVRTDAQIYEENASSFLDNSASYPLTVQTSWLAIAGIQGFERLRHLLALGDQFGTTSGHGIQISTAINFIPTFTAHTPFIFTTNGSTSTPFQFRQFLTQQKCDSMSLLIQEVVTGASGEYMDLTNLSFNCGIKKGLHKVRAAVSVG